MRGLLRFYGFQRIAASLVGGALMWLSVQVFGSTPPEYWHEWPPRASIALSSLVAGSLSAAFCGWVFLLLRPLLWRGDWLGFLCQAAFGLTLISGVGGAWQCVVGGYYLLSGEEGCIKPVLTEWMRVIGWPLLIGGAPVLLLELYQLALVEPNLRRWFTSGRGHAATWIRTPELRQLAKPLASGTKGQVGHVEEY